MITLCDQARSHRAIVERADGKRSDAIPTPYVRLRWLMDEIYGHWDLQQRVGLQVQHKELEEVLEAIWDQNQTQTEELAKQKEQEKVLLEEKRKLSRWRWKCRMWSRWRMIKKSRRSKKAKCLRSQWWMSNDRHNHRHRRHTTRKRRKVMRRSSSSSSSNSNSNIT